MARLRVVAVWLVLALAGCGGKAPFCDFDDLDDASVSTTNVHLYRLAGCPIGMVSNGADREAMICPPASSLTPLLP